MCFLSTAAKNKTKQNKNQTSAQLSISIIIALNDLKQ
jgi:hypothetical protein